MPRPDLPDYMVYRPAYDDGQPGMYWGCNIHVREFGHWFTRDAPAQALEEAQRHAFQAHGWEPDVTMMSSEQADTAAALRDLLVRAAAIANVDPDPRWHTVADWLAEESDRIDEHTPHTETRHLATVARALTEES